MTNNSIAYLLFKNLVKQDKVAQNLKNLKSMTL